MRVNEHISEILQKRSRLSAEIAGCLLQHPDCLNGDSQKEKAYKVAIQYLVEKKADTQKLEGICYSFRPIINLQVLIDCYKEYEGEKKQEYAKKITENLIETQEYYLMKIPEEIKNIAFQIAIQYLEEQMRK